MPTKKKRRSLPRWARAAAKHAGVSPRTLYDGMCAPVRRVTAAAWGERPRGGACTGIEFMTGYTKPLTPQQQWDGFAARLQHLATPAVLVRYQSVVSKGGAIIGHEKPTRCNPLVVELMNLVTLAEALPKAPPGEERTAGPIEGRQVRRTT